MEEQKNFDSILGRIDIDLVSYFVSPQNGYTTQIGAMLVKCIFPLKVKLLKVPRKILHHIEVSSRNSNKIFPIQIAEIYKTVLKLEYQLSMPHHNTGEEDLLRFFTSPKFLP